MSSSAIVKNRKAAWRQIRDLLDALERSECEKSTDLKPVAEFTVRVEYPEMDPDATDEEKSGDVDFGTRVFLGFGENSPTVHHEYDEFGLSMLAEMLELCGGGYKQDKAESVPDGGSSEATNDVQEVHEIPPVDPHSTPQPGDMFF